MTSRRGLVITLGLAGLVGLVGCSKDTGQFATVSGTVSFNGTPVDGAKVEFHSTTESEGKRASFSTVTDSSGKYMIAGSGKNPGILPGMYKVVITKLNIPAGANVPKEGVDSGQLEAQLSDGAGGKSAITNLLPKEYGSLASSKLAATVEMGKNENVNFDLKGK